MAHNSCSITVSGVTEGSELPLTCNPLTVVKGMTLTALLASAMVCFFNDVCCPTEICRCLPAVNPVHRENTICEYVPHCKHFPGRCTILGAVCYVVISKRLGVLHYLTIDNRTYSYHLSTLLHPL
jgi:hypothetical protein